MVWVWHVARVGQIGAYRDLVGKPEGKRPLGEPKLGQCRNGPSRNRIVVIVVGGGLANRTDLTEKRDKWQAV